MKPILLILLPLTTLFLIYGVVVFWKMSQQLGAVPNGNRLARFESSPQFDSKTGRFQNEFPPEGGEPNPPFFTMLKLFLFGHEIRIPRSPLPTITPDLQAFLDTSGANSQETRVIWLGHSTLLLNMSGRIILIDPTLSKRVAPVHFLGNRFQPPPLTLEQIPELDFIVLSHDHYDHLDRSSVRFLKKRLKPGARIITALGVGARLESFGIEPDMITELDWWEKYETGNEAGNLSFTATPAQHFSGRSFNDRQ
ncbi:MAG: MBL fold metallo-hydrolase, partial [Bdellovibrionales bacterium]|nr:MBL fold metallo-hydrolase [Bdellovibrionales bacterium]